jgi:hypothetical protein
VIGAAVAPLVARRIGRSTLHPLAGRPAGRGVWSSCVTGPDTVPVAIGATVLPRGPVDSPAVRPLVPRAVRTEGPARTVAALSPSRGAVTRYPVGTEAPRPVTTVTAVSGPIGTGPVAVGAPRTIPAELPPLVSPVTTGAVTETTR